MLLKPDLHTLTVLPWTESSNNVIGRLICEIYEFPDRVYEGDGRAILQKIVAEASCVGKIGIG